MQPFFVASGSLRYCFLVLYCKQNIGSPIIVPDMGENKSVQKTQWAINEFGLWCSPTVSMLVNVMEIPRNVKHPLVALWQQTHRSSFTFFRLLRSIHSSINGNTIELGMVIIKNEAIANVVRLYWPRETKPIVAEIPQEPTKKKCHCFVQARAEMGMVNAK